MAELAKPGRASCIQTPADEIHRLMQHTDEIFAGIKHKHDQQIKSGTGLICKHGFYRGCSVLKLQQADWTNDSMDVVPNKSGIFFSIWVDEKSLKGDRALYNIHALKLRMLKHYFITSIDFAKDFRQRFLELEKYWPNVSTKYGPLTLMQGWIDINPASFENDVLRLMRLFTPVSDIINELLEQRRR